MERRQYTPTRQSNAYTSASYIANPPKESYKPNGQLAIIRQFQHLKNQARQLQIQNRQLTTQVEKLRYQKSLQENKLMQKVSFEEEAINLFQKEKNYQIQLLKIKNEEDVNRMRRQYEIKTEDIQREIKLRENVTKDLLDKSSFIESKSGELRSLLQELEHELIQYRNHNSKLTEQLTKEEFVNKKLQMLAEELEMQKNEMEVQIHVLLDIEADKSRNIMNLEIKLQNSQNSQKSLHQKLSMLTDNFSSLEEHISVMKDRLINADIRGQQVDKQLQHVQIMIAQKQNTLLQQKDRQGRLRSEIDSHRQRQMRRVNEVQNLIEDNDRIYRQLANARHRLYNVSIQQGIDL